MYRGGENVKCTREVEKTPKISQTVFVRFWGDNNMMDQLWK